MTLREQVLAFHRKFGQPIGEKPLVPDEAMVRFRLKLIAEEFCELLAAAGISESAIGLNTALQHLNVIDSKVDLPEFVDAMADLMYVIEGTAIVFGVDMEPVLAEVQRANLSKDAVYVEAKDSFHQNATTKPVKPPGWTPPDIVGELKKQGWRGPCPACGQEADKAAGRATKSAIVFHNCGKPNP